MAVQSVAGQASQLINSSTNISIPIVLPVALAKSQGNGYTVNVWINSDWGTSAAQRGRRSFVGIYGPAARTPGLAGAYYSNKTMSEPPVLVRADSNIAVNLPGGTAPAPGVDPNAYSIRWTGSFNPPTTSPYYYFRTNSDDGVRVTINGVVVITNWTDHSATLNTSGAVSLTAGTEVPIVVEFYNQGGEGICQLTYGIGSALGGPTSYAAIPNTAFNTSAPNAQTMTAMQIGTVLGAGEISCWTYGGAVLTTTATDFAPQSNNKWINVCYTWDGEWSKLYVDGTLAAAAATAQNPGMLKYVTINGYMAGAAAETDSHSVDCYMLYNRALSDDEVLTIFQAEGGRHGIWNGLVAQYEFDELPEGSNATNVLDLSGNGATLLMVGNGAAPKYTYQNAVADSNIRPPTSP